VVGVVRGFWHGDNFPQFLDHVETLRRHKITL